MTDMKTRTPGWVPDLSTFGARLALVRQGMGWGNVKQAAELCSIPAQSWRAWERDGIVPRSYINVCMKIAGVTGVDLNWLAVGPQPENADYSETAVAVTGRYHPGASIAVTRGYHPGERVVAAITKVDLAHDQGKPRTVTRARPIDRHPLGDRSDV